MQLDNLTRHACGHNLIAICGIGPALAVKDAITKFDLKLNVRVLGTPAEERGSGKIDLIEGGVFSGIDFAIMAHPGNIDCPYAKYLGNLHANMPYISALQQIDVEYFGKAAHAAASPWDGVNALDACVNAYQSIALLRQQALPTTRIHGIIRHGGDAPNIIPAYTKSEYFIRSSKIRQLNELRPRVMNCFKASELATGCLLEVTLQRPLYDVNYNESMLSVYQKHMQDMGIVFADRHTQESVSRGSTDMGNVTYVVPGTPNRYSF
jgi:amidohydrolase